MRVKLDEGAFKIERAYEYDAGYDIKTPVDVTVPAFSIIDGAGTAVIDTGVHVEIPRGCAGFLKSKSGLNVKNNLTGEGVIDCGYTGSIVVKLYNPCNTSHRFSRGDKLIQLVIVKIDTPEIEYVDELDDTDRSSNGFGSSGR